MKLYPYVGPIEIRERCRNAPKGTVIASAQDLENWIEGRDVERKEESVVILTFVIDEQEQLRVAERNSEHVACAGGESVFSAGEMFVRVDKQWIAEEISNQSTGYCPEPESWEVVSRVLDRIGIAHPGEFTQEIVFRLCPECGERNIVKDEWFVCAVCESELPREYNFGDEAVREGNR